MPHPLDPLLKPKTVALVGASNREDSPGHILADLVLNSAFRGKAFPVNPGYASIHGQPCYPDLASLPETVEHAVLAVSNERLEQALADAILHGAKAATIYSSCMLENDAPSPLKHRLSSMAKEAGIAICGGNGMGFYNIAEQLYAGMYPLPGKMRLGSISFIAQSGSAFSALAHNGVRLNFNLCVSSGNEMATTVADYMDWSLAQEETRVIGLFLETLRDPDGFTTALKKSREQDVPVVMLKVGKSPLGAEMAQTHTGAVAGDHAAYEALFKKFGVIEVTDFEELIATLLVFQSPRRTGIGQLATIQESGGLMELATDIAHDLGVPFAPIEMETKTEIQKHLEHGLKAGNPLDAWGSNENFENRFYYCLSALMRDRNVAAGMFITNFRDGYYLSEAFYRVVEKVSLETDKPLVMANCHGDLAHEDLCHRTRDACIPFIDGMREAMLAIKHLFSYRDFRNKPAASRVQSNARPGTVEKWKSKLSNYGRCTLAEDEAMDMLKDFSIDVPVLERIANDAALIAATKRTGYPVVLKTAEADIEHKSDYGGVVANIPNEQSLLREYQKLSSSLGPNALACQMIEPGTEIGLGMVNDPQFGPVIMLAAGGILIEILKDRAVALAPVDTEQAEEMLTSLKSDALISGIRGQAAGNRGGLINMVVAFSHMCYELRDHISEIDINPVIVNQRHAVAVDALVITQQGDASFETF